MRSAAWISGKRSRPERLATCLALLSASASALAQDLPVFDQALGNASPSRVTLVTINPNLGDNIVFEYGRALALRRKYPEAELRVVSPTSWILRPHEGFVPVNLSLPDPDPIQAADLLIAGPEAVTEPLLRQLDLAVPAGGWVVWDEQMFSALGDRLVHQALTSGRLRPDQFASLGGPHAFRQNLETRADQLAERLSSGMKELVSRKKAGGIAHPGWISNSDVTRSLTIHPPDGPPIRRPLPADLAFRPGDNAYAVAERQTRHFLGEAYLPEWPEAAFADVEASNERARGWRKTTLGDPERPYFILNLGTRGQFKVTDLKRDAPARLEELIELVRRARPDADILVAPFERNFGEQVLREVDAILDAQAKKGRLAALPEDRTLWPGLISRAEGIVSQDSGFVHVANIYNPRVLALSRGSSNFRNHSRTWQRPGRASGIFGIGGPGSKAFGPDVEAWIRSPCDHGIREAARTLLES